MILYSQKVTTDKESSIKFWTSWFATVFFFLGIGLTTIEITSYIVLYYHISCHNNNKTIQQILDKNTIKNRNRTNAISLTGMFLSWAWEVWYLLLVGIVRYLKSDWLAYGYLTGIISLVINDANWFRELATLIKCYEFYFIPLVQIYTSAPIRRFKNNLDKKHD